MSFLNRLKKRFSSDKSAEELQQADKQQEKLDDGLLSLREDQTAIQYQDIY